MQSVMLQKMKHEIDYIVIDGGSSDASVNIIETHASNLTFWISEPDDGQSAAIAKGFEYAKGDVLAWLNSDDVLSLDAVETAVDFFKKNPDVDMIYGNRLALDEKGRILYRKRMLPFGANSPYVSMIVGQESCFFRRSAYERVGGINPERNFSMDYELFSKIAQSGRIRYCPNLWGAFRIHSDSRTMKEYASAGREDVRAVQDLVWRRRPSYLAWHGMSVIVKLWGLSSVFMRNKGCWPDGLISSDRLSWMQRLGSSFHDGSYIRRLVDPFCK